MLRGFIYTLTIFLSYFLLISLIEYFGNLSSQLREVIFWTSAALIIFLLFRNILIPLFQLLKIGDSLSYKEAARIIGVHFREIEDKLLNILELEELAEKSENNELILTSIEKKTEAIKPIPFELAVNFKENLHYLKYLAIPLAVILTVLILSPRMVTESTARIIKYKKDFNTRNLFHFVIENDSLAVVKGNDFVLKIKSEGEFYPEEASILINGKEYAMKPLGAGRFSYSFRSVITDKEFRIVSGNYSTSTYYLKVLPLPLLRSMQMFLQYPDYTGLEDENKENIGDVMVPEGTHITWRLKSDETEDVIFLFGEKQIHARRTANDEFQFSDKFFKTTPYEITLANRYIRSTEPLKYNITVIPDAYPSISVSEFKDSFNFNYLFFQGEMADDYGITRLDFVYEIIREEDTIKEFKIIENIGKLPNQYFDYNLDLSALGINKGEQLRYYFRVWDNDAIHGPKYSISRMFYLNIPAEEEMKKQLNQMESDLEQRLENTVRKAQRLKNDIEEIKKRMLNSRELNWEDKKFIENVLKEERSLKQEMEDLKKEFQKKVNYENNINPIQDDLLKKYEDLYKLFDEIFPEELKEKIEELQRMLEKELKDEIEKNLDRMKLNQENLSRELDRMLDMFKKLQFERKTEQLINDLKNLSEKQEKLSEETREAKKKEDFEKLKEKQQELNEKFDEIKEEFEDNKKLNEELNNPVNMNDINQDIEDIDKEQQNAGEQLNMGKKNKASQHQKNAGAKMKQAANNLNSMLMQMKQQQLEINIAKLREILENLLYISFEQENLFNKFYKETSYNPRYVELVEQQKQLKDISRMVEDSLDALSRELPQMSSYINQKISEINFDMNRVLEQLSDRNTPTARIHQQKVMKEVNDLTLMLSEILKNLQSEMMSSMSGSQSMKKRGQGQMPDISDLKKLQEQLNKQLQQMKEGKKPGGEKMSRQLAEMIAKQEMIRNAIRQMQMEKIKNGDKPSDLLNELQQLMEQTEKELANKKLTNKLLKRQEEIRIKLLEAEKAERKQEEEERRESKTANQLIHRQPPSLEKYLQEKKKNSEVIIRSPAEFKPYYKKKVQEYYQLLPR